MRGMPSESASLHIKRARCRCLYKALYRELFVQHDIRRYNIDDRQSNRRMLLLQKHCVGKKGMQCIEGQNPNFRIHIKRLNHWTICFSKLEFIHGAVMMLRYTSHQFLKARLSGHTPSHQ